MDFAHIHAAETEKLRAERAGTATSEAMIGLAFSGGGIRSATFNLGILQGLARRGVLKHIDYLSTVSGGGYIGSWYMSFLKRLADGKPATAEALLNPELNHAPKQTSKQTSRQTHNGEPTVEPQAVLWLRRFSNYLTPKTGLSGDTLTLVSTYLRNLLLNLTVILAFLGAMLLLPRILVSALPRIEHASLLPEAVALPLLIAVLAMVILVITMKPSQPDRSPFPHNQSGVVLLVVLPVLLSAIALSIGLAAPGFAGWAETQAGKLSEGLLALGFRQSWIDLLVLNVPHWESWAATQAIASIVYFLPWALGSIWVLIRQIFKDLQRQGGDRDLPGRMLQTALHFGVMLLAGLIASLLAGGLMGGLAEIAARLQPCAHEIIVFGPPLVILAFLKPVGLQIGLARRHFTEMQREWWSRLGGWLIATALTWLFLTSIALYGPYLMSQLNHWLLAGGGLFWLATTGWGLLAAKGAKTGTPGGSEGHKLSDRLLGLAPWVFVLGLLGMVSFGLQKGLEQGQEEDQGNAPATLAVAVETTAIKQPATPAATPQIKRADIATALADVSGRKAVAVALVLGAIFLLLGWRIDINLFSFHNFYRNRLTRCYLGASRSCWPENQNTDCRKPNPFTGFDPADDLALAALPLRPYPIYNTALNLVGGHELAWQQRKAASFIFSPLFCGYELPVGMGRSRGAYRETGCFLAGELKGEYRDEPVGQRGVRLGTAIAVSGAAVNPNMGFHSSPAVAFLLTVFNVRLGRWVGNPEENESNWRKTAETALFALGKLSLTRRLGRWLGNHERSKRLWRKTSPDFGVRYLFLELFGLTSQDRDWLNLSDGGHFENLGIYELVRRRLPYIIAVDAAEDADYHFDDLANAIRKIRADFGIDIEIDLAGLRPLKEDGRQTVHAAIGVIRYDQIHPLMRPGVLVYLRPGLTGNEPADVLSYARKHPPFPFESTVDQFFDESQFESYRKLGLHIADSVLREAAERHSTQLGAFNPEAFFTVLREAWRGRLKVNDGVSAAHHERLDALFERLRSDPDLAFLSAEFFPEWPELLHKPRQAMELPAYEAQRQSGFYLCREIAQLMERVYQDLDLENQHDHPDSRGWMNLFRHWSWSPMFRATYAITAATLSERFQRFCNRRLQLDLGVVELVTASLNADSLAELNFVERDIIETSLTKRHGLTLARFELVIRYPGENATEVELLRFHFGFAVLAGQRLIGLRIQDHLRRMGLARQAMTRLQEDAPDLALDSETFRTTREPGTPESPASLDQAVLRHLFESVRAIMLMPGSDTREARDKRWADE
jgi:hypothetical protein